MKAVFDTKPNSGYDDEITRQYQFPNRADYMKAALAAVGDWVVFREPQRNAGRRGYVAVARVLDVRPDPLRLKHSLAIVGEFLPLDNTVPTFGPKGYWEE